MPATRRVTLAALLALALVGATIGFIAQQMRRAHAAGYAGGVVQIVSRRALRLTPDQIRHMRARFWICDNTAITADLGWQPSIGLDEGFASTLTWYREQRWL
jgi:nucleoside-diphosphate-sugar epimerase